MDETKQPKTSLRKHIYILEGTHAFIGIDKRIVDELQLTEDDVFIEEATKEGILLRRQEP